MKYIVLVTAFSLIALLTFAQVEQTHIPLLIKKTATWCPYCGGWGWDLQNDLEERNDDIAVIVQAHPSESCELFDNTSKNLMDSLPVTDYYPFWFVNGERRYDYFLSVNYNKSIINQYIDSTRNEPPLANCHYSFDIHNDTLDVTTTTKFFQDTSGTFYLSVWIIESGVFAAQNGLQGEDPYHSNVLRASMSNAVFGEQIIDGPVQIYDSIISSFSMVLDTSWRLQNTHLAFVIWQRTENYTYVNAFKDGKMLGKDRVVTLENDDYIYPNPVADKLQFVNPYDEGEGWANLYNLNGQLLLRQKLNLFINEVDLSDLAAGMYVLKLEGPGDSRVFKIVKRQY